MEMKRILVGWIMGLLAVQTGLYAQQTLDKRLENHEQSIRRELENLKENIRLELQKDRENVEKRIEDQNRLIENTNTHFNFFLTMIGFAATAFGIVGFFSFGERARKEARIEVDNWFNNNAKHVTDKLEADFEELKKDYEAHISKKKSEVDDAIDEFKESIYQKVSHTANVQIEFSQDEKKRLIEKEILLKQKPEIFYSYDEFDTRALAAFSRNDYITATHFWEEAQEKSDIRDVQRVHAIFYRGLSTNRQKLYNKAIQIFDALLKEYGHKINSENKIYIIKSMRNKGSAYNNLKDYDSAKKVYLELVEKFNDDEDANILEHVAKACNGIGYSDLMNAKIHWGKETVRKEYLLSAKKYFLDSENLQKKNLENYSNSETYANLAYCTHLLKEDVNDVQSLISKALESGGEKLYELILDDIDSSIIGDEDEKFKNLVVNIWNRMKENSA